MSIKTNYERELTWQRCYSGGQLALSSDGAFFACACGDTVKIVETQSGKTLQTIEPKAGAIAAVGVLHNDTEVFVALDIRQIQHWSLGTANVSGDDATNTDNSPPSATLVHTWKAHQAPVRVMAFDTSGTLMATAGADRTIMVWDVVRHYCTHVFRDHKFPVTSVVFHPTMEQHTLMSGDEGGFVHRWDLKAKTGQRLEAHASAVTGIVITDDGLRAVSAGRDSVLCVWDLRETKLTRSIALGERVEGLAIITQSTEPPPTKKRRKKQQSTTDTPTLIVTVGERGKLRLWDLDSGKTRPITDNGGLGEYVSLSVSQNGKTLMAPTTDRLLVRFSFADNELRRSGIVIGDNDVIYDLKFVGKNHLLLVNNSELARVVNTNTLECQLLVGHSDLVMACGVAADGRRFATCGKDNSMRVYSAKAGDADGPLAVRCIAVCKGHTETVNDVACSRSSSGARSLLVTASRDLTLKVWQIPEPKSDVYCDLTVVSDEFYDAPLEPRAKATRLAHTKEINCVNISPDDKLVASGSADRSIRLWKLPELKAAGVLLGHRRGVWSLEFAPKLRALVSASADKSLRLWSLADRTCLRAFEGHASAVLRVALLCDGNEIASTSSDGVLKLWRASNGDCINTFDAHDARPWALAQRSNGEMLVTGADDSSLVFWRDRTAADDADAAAERAQRVAGEQELMNHERRGHLGAALRVALRLELPSRCLSIVQKMLDAGVATVPTGIEAATRAAKRQRDDGDTDAPPRAASSLVDTIFALDDEQLSQLLLLAREWHSTRKAAPAGVRVLRCVLVARSIDQLLDMPATRQALSALLPYAARHRTRAERLTRRAALLQFATRKFATTTTMALHTEAWLGEADRSDDDDDDSDEGNNFEEQLKQ